LIVKRRQLAVLLLWGLFFSTSQPLYGFFYHFSEDPNNAYQWNRQNLDNGKIDTGDWYEWWFYKVNDPKTGDAFFFCYGVVNPWDKDGTSAHSRAFVTFGDFKKKIILSSTHPISQFNASYDSAFIQVGNHTSDGNHLEAQFNDQGHTVQWNLEIQKKISWNAMGWGMDHPSLFNIYWYPAQMEADISGTLIIDGKEYFFEKADGYQDRNWGRTFPKWWFWISANSFLENPQSSFVGGGGDAQISYGVPVPTAILLALHHEGELYEFRSSEPHYFFEWKINLGHWELTATNLDYRLKVLASADSSQFMDIQFPTPTGEIFHDYETLNGQLHIELYKNKSWLGWEKIVDLSTKNTAGLEYGQDHP